MELREVGKIGSEDGVTDAFGQVTDIAIDSQNHIYVADASTHSISIFDLQGRKIGSLGRRGEGPGEFQFPVTLMIDDADSVFVWDMSLARVSVFSPKRAFVRSFNVRPSWVMSSLQPLQDGTLIATGYTRGQVGSLHKMSRSGELLRTYPVGNPPEGKSAGLYGYDVSLLGGNAAIDGLRIVFASKSPYELTILSLDGSVINHCVGQAEWTTPPQEVVKVDGRRVSLEWNRYVHVTNVLVLSPQLYLVNTRDPVRDVVIADVIQADCTLVRRTELPALSFHSVRGDLIAALRTTDFQEVIIYKFVIRSRDVH